MKPIRVLLLLSVAMLSRASAADVVTFKQAGRQHSITGQVQVKAQDGGLLLLAPDGVLWPIQPDELVSHQTTDEPFAPWSREEMIAKLSAEFPGFEVHQTTNYLIVHNTSKAYAQWVGALYERLFAAFTNYWSRRGMKLSEPSLPLIAVVFDSQQSYLTSVSDELGEAAKAIVGYYSLRSNRVQMFDLTGSEANRQPGDRRGSSAEINRMLNRPQAAAMVATIIHEATHQIAFNTGLHQRFADVPLWLSEGLAVYFESPDLGSSKGWRTIGAVHHSRLEQFMKYLPVRPAGSLGSLVTSDDRIRNTDTAANAYAEAWALNYFLIRQRPKQYVAYLELMSQKGPLVWDDPETRYQQFRSAFGDIETLDAEFVKYIQKLR